MQTNVKLSDEIQAAADTLQRIERRKPQSDYQRGYLEALGDLLSALDIGELPPAQAGQWREVDTPQLEDARGNGV